MRGGKRDQSGKRPRDEDDFEFDDGEDEELSSRDRALPSECLDSCVKLFVTHCEPNYSLPWTMRHQTSSTSSGFIIDGKRILTNAHCVEDYTVVKVKKRGGADKFVAEVLAIGRGTLPGLEPQLSGSTHAPMTMPVFGSLCDRLRPGPPDDFRR
eukprot:1235420-Prymnesium_polylepis.1